MSFKKDNEEQNEEVLAGEDFEEIVEEIKEIEETESEDNNVSSNNEVNALKEALARKQADYENFKKRVERDREDMIHFMKADILKKTLPWLDNIERIIKNTPEDMKNGAVFEGILAVEKAMKSDLEKMGVRCFESLGCEIDPDKHEVMTQVPGESGKVVDEFEKGYVLGDKVIRVAKVIAGI
ncbi:MAG: nucleotide exchange factor GrpE [Candidatus Gracilibacteria bacterium]|nr:nucleotide exchange factor GrpE [Candidatus Gracilibacteria bacterium]